MASAERVRSPVVMVTYRRPDTTARVLDAVRAARPSRLLVIGNAAMPGREGEPERVAAVRELIETVDWDCEVSTEYAGEHLGMRERFETGLGWAFSQVEEAIVLEDDCVPDPTFFRFCDELLERYRDDERVMSIGGTSVQASGREAGDSYFFSRYPAIWGWASWRRSWGLYDPEMSAWPELRDSGWLERTFDEPHAAAYWAHLLERSFRGDDAWDRVLLFAGLSRGLLHAIPNVNLVSNVGFREDATHTGPGQRGALDEMPAKPMGFPLRHPAAVARDADGDAVTERVVFSGAMGSLFERARGNVRAGRTEA